MDIVEATKTCLRKYFVFRGRAQRSEYWYFYLFTIIGSLVFWGADLALFERSRESLFGDGSEGLFVDPPSSIFGYLTFIPVVSAGARRLHDTGRSGWLQLLPLASLLPVGFFMAGGGGSVALTIGFSLVALVLLILLIIWLATDSHEGENRFGPSPKYGGIASTFD